MTTENKKYLAHIKTLRCYIAYGCQGDVVPHHIEAGGMGMKCSDYLVIPLCTHHHREIHQIGKETFQNNHQISLYKPALLNLVTFIETHHIKIEPEKLTRSLAQNSLFWMWLDIWGKELGYTKDEMYDVSVSQCWPIHDEELICNGLQIARQRRTSQLKVNEFTNLLNNIDIKAAQTGCLLPRPEDIYWLAMGIKRKG